VLGAASFDAESALNDASVCVDTGPANSSCSEVPNSEFFLAAKVEKRFEFIVRIQAQRAQPVTAINLNSDAGHSFLNDRLIEIQASEDGEGDGREFPRPKGLKNPRAQEFPLVAISLNAKGQPGPDQPPIFHPSTCGGGRHERVADLHSLPLPLNFGSPAWGAGTDALR